MGNYYNTHLIKSLIEQKFIDSSHSSVRICCFFLLIRKLIIQLSFQHGQLWKPLTCCTLSSLTVATHRAHITEWKRISVVFTESKAEYTQATGPGKTQQDTGSGDTHSAGCWDRWGGWCWWHGRTHILDPCSPGSVPAVVRGTLRCPGNQTTQGQSELAGKVKRLPTCYGKQKVQNVSYSFYFPKKVFVILKLR